jgi:tetratricopeptide (TPR) repeat protein
VAEQTLAINPLIAAPHRYLADAAEAVGNRQVAIDEQRILLTMNPPDLAEAHYRLARLLADAGSLDEAHRQVVLALEEAPRFRDAHRLLLAIIARTQPQAPTTQEAR